MSQQELATTMAAEETEGESSPLAWFKRNFFTPKVEANRESNFPQLALREPARYWGSITQKLDRSPCGKTTHVMLHLDPSNGLFHFKSPRYVNPLPVTEGVLTAAVEHPGDWVPIRLGTETLRLKHAELKAEFIRLRKLRNGNS